MAPSVVGSDVEQWRLTPVRGAADRVFTVLLESNQPRHKRVDVEANPVCRNTHRSTWSNREFTTVLPALVVLVTLLPNSAPGPSRKRLGPQRRVSFHHRSRSLSTTVRPPSAARGIVPAIVFPQSQRVMWACPKLPHRLLVPPPFPPLRFLVVPFGRGELRHLGLSPALVFGFVPRRLDVFLEDFLN